MMHKYARDPYWLTARFNSTCTCGQPITKGQRIFYYPNGRQALCPQCSEKASAEFSAAAADEAMLNGQNY